MFDTVVILEELLVKADARCHSLCFRLKEPVPCGDLDVDVIKGGDGRGLCKLIESSTGKLVTSVCVPAQWTKVPRNVEIAHVYVHATLSDLIKEVQVCLTIPASAVELDQQPFCDNGQLTFADSCVEMETCSDGDLADIPELLRPGDENVASRGNKRSKTGADPAQAASPSPPQPPQRFKSKAPDSVPGSGNGDAAQADATPCGGETKRRARLLHDLQSHDERSQQKRFSGQLYWQQYCKRLPLNNVKIGVTGEKGMGLYLQDAKGAGEELWREPPFAHMLTKGQLGKLCVYCCRAVGGELFTVNSEPSPWLHYCCARHGELDVQLRLDFPGKRDMTLSTDAAARSWGTLATLRLFIAKRWHCDSGRGVEFFFPEHLQDQEWKLIGPTVLSNVYAGLHRYRELPLENMPDAMRRRVLQHELPSWHQLGKKEPELVQSEERRFALDVASANTMSIIGEDGETSIAVGLFLAGSLLNHSCSPNCIVSFEGSALVVRALRAIKPHEELTISYIDVLSSASNRQAWLARRYGFVCDCEVCRLPHTAGEGNAQLWTVAAEHVESEAKRKRRARKAAKKSADDASSAPSPSGPEWVLAPGEGDVSASEEPDSDAPYLQVIARVRAAYEELELARKRAARLPKRRVQAYRNALDDAERELAEAHGVLHPGHEVVLIILALMVDVAQEGSLWARAEGLADRLLSHLPIVVFEHAPVLTRVYVQRGEARLQLARAAREGAVPGEGRSAAALAELAREDLNRAVASYTLCFGGKDVRVRRACALLDKIQKTKLVQ